MHLSGFGGTALLLAAMLTSAHAQNTLPPNVPPPGGVNFSASTGVTAVLPPPAGFSPLTASPLALEQYAIPPAPDPVQAPKAYAEWHRAVAGPTKHVAPIITQTNISNGPVRKVGPTVPISPDNTIVAGTSSNWSGTSAVNTKDVFKLEAIQGMFVVPTAHQAFGACDGGWDLSSQWPGIDGNGSNDVLQGGVEADAYCNGSTKVSFYSAWIEWFPFAETRVSSPAINPGDEIFVEVWNTSPTNGYVYFYNYSTLESATYNLTAPSGTTLVGNSIEWIVERPGLNGGLATLTNYIAVPWPVGTAWNYKAAKPVYYFEGKNPPQLSTLEVLTMNDDNGVGISAPTLESGEFLWFQDFGSACGRSGAPPC